MLLAGALLLVSHYLRTRHNAGVDHGDSGDLPVSAGGVTLSRVPARGVGGQGVANAGEGDFLLESKNVRLVVGGYAEGMERRAQLGTIVDLVDANFADDRLIEWRPMLELSGQVLSLRCESVKVDAHGVTPALVLTHSARDGALRVETRLVLNADQPYVEITSRLVNRSKKTLESVSLGERLRFRGQVAFAPRLGFVHATARADVAWIASTGGPLSYAISAPGAELAASFVFDRFGSTGQETLSQPRSIEPGAELSVRRLLSVTRGGLERAAEIAWRAGGKKLGIAAGVIGQTPRWATVEARYADGQPALVAHVDSAGRYEFSLPEGDYQLLLRAPGGEDQRAVHIDAGVRTTPPLIAPRAGTLHYRVRDEADRPLPARLIVSGVPPTPDPEFGPIELAVGAKNNVYTQGGEGYLDLLPGRYRVVATHGTEYSVAREELEVNPDVGATFRAVLTHEVDTTGYIACDFHLHQAPSFDSTVPIDDRVLSLLAEDVEFAVPTDHNHVTDFSEYISGLHAETQLGSTPGVEITTENWGHFNAFPYPAAERPPPYEVDPQEIFNAVRTLAPDAVLQVNHPRMPGCGYFNKGELDAQHARAETAGFSFEFDTLEVVNGYDLENSKLIDDNLHEWFALLNAGKHYTAVGNSDSHRLVYHWAGYPRTYVRVADDRPSAVTPTEIAHALLAGHAEVSNGIFILALANDSAIPGDMVKGSRVKLDVSVRAPAWVDAKVIELFVNGELSQTHPIPERNQLPLRLDWETSLELKSDAFLVVRVRGEGIMNDVLPDKWVKPFAFTNPIYVDVNGDGVCRPHAP
ncbi:MAG TPA: CehA/McbA family metallohydrolase [Polyangiaceae bacterium]